MAWKMSATELSAFTDTPPQWKIKFLETAEKQLAKLDKETSRILNRYIAERLVTPEDPRRFGKPLSGNLKEFWCYRVGDYRLICELHDHVLTISVIKIGHRKEVYD